MRYRKRNSFGGPAKFFRLTLSQDSLVNYYKLNFSLMHHHQYSLTELENMIPWEREIYVSLLIDFIREQNEKTRLKLASKGKI